MSVSRIIVERSRYNQFENKILYFHLSVPLAMIRLVVNRNETLYPKKHRKRVIRLIEKLFKIEAIDTIRINQNILSIKVDDPEKWLGIKDEILKTIINVVYDGKKDVSIVDEVLFQVIIA